MGCSRGHGTTDPSCASRATERPGFPAAGLSGATTACDAAHQEIPPVKAAGSEYVSVRYRTRTPGTEETVPWRIMGMVAGTTLTYDPPQTTAPATLGAGQLVEFEATGPFDVKSQDAMHPFYLAGHMTGGSLAGGLGDPETVNIAPPAQYLHMPVGNCDNGLHTISSTAPFGVTVWGFDQWVSYAYPAGASVKPINNVVVPPTLQ